MRRRRRRPWDTRGARPGWGPGGGRGGRATRLRVSPGCVPEAPPVCGARPGALPASLEVSASGAARTCPITSTFKESISPVGAVTRDRCLQVAPEALKTGRFSWLVGERCLSRAEETESGTRRPGALSKGPRLSLLPSGGALEARWKEAAGVRRLGEEVWECASPHPSAHSSL